MAYTSWFNKIRAGFSVKGAPVGGVLHKGDPAKNKNGGWKKGKCKFCGSPNGFVFISRINPQVEVLFCQRCGKYHSYYEEAAPEPRHDDRCLATTSKGHRCKNKAGADGYCNHPAHRAEPYVVTNPDGSASVHGTVTGMGF